MVSLSIVVFNVQLLSGERVLLLSIINWHDLTIADVLSLTSLAMTLYNVGILPIQVMLTYIE